MFFPNHTKDMSHKSWIDQTPENIIFTVLWDTTVAPFLNENAQNLWSFESFLSAFSKCDQLRLSIYLSAKQKQLDKVGLVKHKKKRCLLYFVRLL